MKIDKKLVMYSVGGIAALTLYIFSRSSSNSESSSPSNADKIEINITNSVYESKKQAYDDLIASKRNQNNHQITSVYDRIIEDSLKKKEEEEIKQKTAQDINSIRYSANISENIKELNRQRNSNPQPTVTQNSSYQSVRQEIDSMLGKRKTKTASATYQKESVSDREKRMKALRESWNGTEKENGQNSYRAVIHGSQTVKSGAVAILRLSEPLSYSGGVIPRNTLLHGKVMSINNTRLDISITSARIGNNIIPLSLDLYGTDGIKGIPITVNTSTNIADSEVKDEAIDQVNNVARNFGTVGRVVGSIATATARATKREKDIEVRLIDNQTVFLKPTTK